MSAQAQVDFDKIKIEGALRAAFDSFASWNSSFAISEEAELPRFRGSAIPHCPIHVAIDHTRSDHRLEERGFMLDYASEHGKLVHALTQKWLGIVGLIDRVVIACGTDIDNAHTPFNASLEVDVFVE